MRSLYHLVLVWLCLASFSPQLPSIPPLLVRAQQQQQQEDTQGAELAQVYIDALLEYDVFPPINDDPEVWKDNSTHPIEVVIGTYITSIDDISPGESEFTLSWRTLMYWRNADCNQTDLHQLACETRLQNGNGLRFVQSTSVKGLPSINTALSVQNIHEQLFIRNQQTDLQPDAEILAGQTTFTHRFDMRDFPYEFHEMKVNVISSYSNNVVRLTSFGVDPAALEPSVPPGWTLHGISCEVGESATGGRTDALTSRPFASYDCTLQVSRKNPSWWMTSFLLFAGVIFMAFLGNLGVMAHEVAEARDDKDGARRALFSGTRLMGTYSIGLVLTYVFQVEDSPYGRPIEFWPTIPTSTVIYVLGLLALLVLSFSGMLGAIIFKVPLVREGFVGRPLECYNIDKLPVEGKQDESHYPLLLKKYIPEAWSNNSAPEEERAPKEGDETAAEASPEAPELAEPQIATGRKNNQKAYNVLSVEEAVLVNRYVRRVFFLQMSVVLVVLLCTLATLLTAKNRYEDAISAVS